MDYVSMYSTTIIYCIECIDINIPDTYVGHTTNFIQRHADHKECVNTSGRKLYSFIRAHGGWSNWCMKPLSRVSCRNKGDACLEELYWYIKMKATLNKVIPGINYYMRAMKSAKLYEKRKIILDRINEL
jgi:hypothetical protein